MIPCRAVGHSIAGCTREHAEAVTTERAKRLAYRWAWTAIAAVTVGFPLTYIRFPFGEPFMGVGVLGLTRWMYLRGWAAGHEATREQEHEDVHRR